MSSMRTTLTRRVSIAASVPGLIGRRPQPIRMALVKRQKLDGPAQHYGVLLVYESTRREVLDLRCDGVRLVSLQAFAEGRRTTVESELCGLPETDAAWKRAKALLRDPPCYRFLDGNCEHFARIIMEGRRRSAQVSDSLGTIVAAVLVLCLIAR